MDIIRRNTDYALRAAVDLAGSFDREPVSTKVLASRCKIPSQLACKLLQRLHRAGIVKSEMGSEGGFMLDRKPSTITVRQVVEAVQGPVILSRCLVSKRFCGLSAKCPVNPELARLQKTINSFLGELTLGQLSEQNGSKRSKR
ncbi:MAG: Rrf2 family transcriptional regulator [Sedimentisphaerales bacterium]|nr:Rrf2 family transcriptional regulator [Sedimentisphaerales bacterium]